MGLSDIIIGWLDISFGWFLFSPNSDVPVVHSSQGRFFVFCLRHIVQNGHNWSKKVISGPGFLKNDDILSDL